mgnify:CR=1 FL=1
MNNTYEEDKEKLLKYKQKFDNDLQDRACKMDWKHDYYFSHVVSFWQFNWQFKMFYSVN